MDHNFIQDSYNRLGCWTNARKRKSVKWHDFVLSHSVSSSSYRDIGSKLLKVRSDFWKHLTLKNCDERFLKSKVRKFVKNDDVSMLS